MSCGCDSAACRLDSGDRRHGTPNGYANLKCRCAACRRAHARFYRQYRALGRYEDPTPCSVSWCTRWAHCRGMCWACYRRWSRGCDVETTGVRP